MPRCDDLLCSSSGLPSSTIRSTCLPTVKVPVVFPMPRSSAFVFVAHMMACIGVSPERLKIGCISV
jgi:hypothetical protein